MKHARILVILEKMEAVMKVPLLLDSYLSKKNYLRAVDLVQVC
jgi:hypothetical protein